MVGSSCDFVSFVIALLVFTIINSRGWLLTSSHPVKIEVAMLLPFVRELFADVEKLPGFSRVASHLKEGTGRISVSGLIADRQGSSAGACATAAERPLIVVVSDNRAVEDFSRAAGLCELTAACRSGVDRRPSHARRAALSESLSASGNSGRTGHRAVEDRDRRGVDSGCARLRPRRSACAPLNTTPDLARTIRRGETFELETLLAHLNTVGYASADVVEMPGQYALRGGILDVYSPEADRPVRIEFFGDEVESIRQVRSGIAALVESGGRGLLLPLTETPVREQLLGAIHVRLSGKRITGNEEVIEQAVRSGGVTVFPGWEFYAPVAREPDRTVFDLLPHAAVLADEPEALKQELDRTGRGSKRPTSAAASETWFARPIFTSAG